MKFDIMSIIFMIVAIWLGTFIGSMLSGMVGFAGGIVGSLIVGFVVYLVWTLLRGQKIAIMQGLIFAVLVYIAQMIGGVISSYTGLGGGLIGIAITAVVLSFLWGFVGAKKRL